MQARVLKENLEAAVVELARTARTRTMLPITRNVLLATEDGRLTATATDLELTVKAYIGAQVETDGASTVPAATLAKMLKRIKADEAVTIKADKRVTTFEMGERTFSLEGDEAEDFPPTPANFEKRGEVYGGELKDRLKKTAICAAGDRQRPILLCVNMRAEDGKLTLAAADGFRLAVFTLGYTGQEFEANVPMSVVTTLIGLLPDDYVGIDMSESTIHFGLGNYEVTGLLVQGSYPNYSKLIPDAYEHAVTVQRDDLRSEVETAMVLASEGSRIIRLQTGEAALRITGRSEETGEYSGSIPAKVEGPPGKVALDGRYLLNLVGSFEAGAFQMDWCPGRPGRPGRPVRLRQGEEGLYVVMPMEVNWP